MTRVQREVLAVLDDGTGFRTAQQVHAALRERDARAGLSSVYRALQGLEQAGEVDVLRAAGSETTYRRCSRRHHHHLVCRSCGTAVEVQGPAVERWARSVAQAQGFSDVEHTLELVGTCADCARRS